jgi:flagellar FliJ protein
LKGFVFNLEKILDLRKYRERETEIELGRAIGALTEVENKLAALALERAQAAEERFSPAHSGADILVSDLYIQRLDRTKDLLTEAAAKAELKVEEARNIYLEASRECKILDKLREKREKAYRKFTAAEEIKATDDISGGTRFHRQLTENL